MAKNRSMEIKHRWARIVAGRNGWEATVCEAALNDRVQGKHYKFRQQGKAYLKAVKSI